MDTTKCQFIRKIRNETDGKIELYFTYYAPKLLELFQKLENVDEQYFTLKIEYPFNDEFKAKAFISPTSYGHVHDWICVNLALREIIRFIDYSERYKGALTMFIFWMVLGAFIASTMLLILIYSRGN